MVHTYDPDWDSDISFSVFIDACHCVGAYDGVVRSVEFFMVMKRCTVLEFKVISPGARILVKVALQWDFHAVTTSWH